MINLQELLKVLRKVREAEKRSIAKVFPEGKTFLPIEEMGIALRQLKYFVSEDAAWEILDACLQERTDESCLTIEEFATFLREYRRTEGFTREELDELEQVFNQHSSDWKSITMLEVGRMLRWFGFALNLPRQQQLVEEIDFDCSGKLELHEFKKMMRRLYSAEAKERQKIFRQCDTHHLGTIHTSKFGELLTLLTGTKPDEQMVTIAIRHALGRVRDANLQVFEKFYRTYRHFELAKIRENAGYTLAEVLRLKEQFQSYDTDGSGELAQEELRRLLAQIFPDATRSHLHQKELMRLLERVDRDKSWTIDFTEFLWLMRACDDMRDASDLKLERSIIKDLGFSADEVDGFRQLFSQSSDLVGEVDVHAMMNLLSSVIDISPKSLLYLTDLMQEIHPEGRGVARFPQFLVLMKKLTEVNALGVNQSVTRILRRDGLLLSGRPAVNFSSTVEKNIWKSLQVKAQHQSGSISTGSMVVRSSLCSVLPTVAQTSFEDDSD